MTAKTTVLPNNLSRAGRGEIKHVVMAAVMASWPIMGPSHYGIVPLRDFCHFGVFLDFGVCAIDGVAVNGVAVDGMSLEPALKPALNPAWSQLGSHPDQASTLGKLSRLAKTWCCKGRLGTSPSKSVGHCNVLGLTRPELASLIKTWPYVGQVVLHVRSTIPSRRLRCRPSRAEPARCVSF